MSRAFRDSNKKFDRTLLSHLVTIFGPESSNCGHTTSLIEAIQLVTEVLYFS